MKYFKYTMDMKTFNLVSIILFIPLFIIISILKLWEYVNIEFLVLYFLWMFLHELLHGMGFSINKNINHKNIIYGAALEKGILYCMCKQEIKKKNIIISLLFPFIFIGITTFFIGLALNNPILQLLSLFNIVGSIGDLVMFFDFIKLPEFNYLDLDDCTGFVLTSKEDLSKYKLFGINLIEKGNYNKLEQAKNYKKINITKLSICTFIILISILVIKMLLKI